MRNFMSASFVHKIFFNIHSVLSAIFPSNPSVPRAGNIYVESLGLLGLFLFLFNINLSKDLYGAGEVVLVIAFILAWKQLKVLMYEPVFWMLLLWIIAVAASTVSGLIRFPFVDSLEQLDEARRMLRYSSLLAIGWWIGANVISWRNALLITLLGFVLSALPWILDWSTLGPMFEGMRPGRKILGFWSIQYATWAGLLLLATVIMGKNLLPGPLKRKKGIFAGYALLSIVAFCLALGVYVTLSRMVWISLCVSLVLSAVLYRCTSSAKIKLSLKNLAGAIVIALVLLVFGVSQFDMIRENERFGDDSTTIIRMFRGEWDQIERTSLGERIHLYRWALNQDGFITFFGWGPLATETISEHEELRELYKWPPEQRHPHLHNDLLEILFRTGILGSLIMILTLFFFVKEVTAGYRRGVIPQTFFVFFITGMFYLVLTGMLNFSLRIESLLPTFGGLLFASILLSNVKIQSSSKSEVEMSAL